MKKIVKKYAIPHKENNFRPHLLRATGVLVMLLFIVGLFVGSEAYRVVVRTSDFIASVLPAVLVDLTNNDRSSNAVNELTVNPILEDAARLKVDDMVAKGYFSHNSPDGVTPWHWISKAGYNFAYAGENLAIHFDDSLAVNAAWMASPGHQGNILNDKFTEIGIAVAKGVYEGRETIFVVQMFGTPQAVPEVASASVVAVSNPVQTQEEETPAPVVALQEEEREVNAPTEIAGTEIAVTPLTSLEPTLEEGNEMFIAVENADALVAENVAGTPDFEYATVFEKFISSPQKMLALAYAVLGVVLLIVLAAVLFINHSDQARHILVIIMLLLALGTLYYAYLAFAPSSVQLALAFSK